MSTKVALDTNCLLDAADESSAAHPSVQKLLAAAAAGRITLCISRHSLSELVKNEPTTSRAKEIAGSLEILSHWPIGAWKDQVCTWDQAAGSWEDARRNEALRLELGSLAKAGSDIRDRGAYLDALRAGVDLFVTSDTQLVGSGPAARLQECFGLRVVTPATLVTELGL